jgi:hypothetical protein
MPRLKFGAAARVLRAVRKVVPPRSRKPANWHWFDHPEMQARIAAAEADRREGRVEKLDSRDAAFAYLDGLA